jgi:hypothetical protein
MQVLHNTSQTKPCYKVPLDCNIRSENDSLKTLNDMKAMKLRSWSDCGPLGNLV